MGDILDSASLQLCGTPAHRRRRGLLAHQAARAPAGAAARGAPLYGNRDAKEQPDRLRLRILRHLHGVCADLAHLVDGGPGRFGRLRDLRGLCLAGPARGHHSGRSGCARRSSQPTCTQRSARRTADGAMSSFDATAGRGDPTLAGYVSDDRHPAEHAAGGVTSKRIVAGYGFWIFLLSDIVMFSAFFATYAVLVGETAGGPSGHELFDLRNTAIETACLLLSSFACGLAGIGAQAHRGSWFY